MTRLGKWSLTVVTMTSVVTAVLLVTGWGPAVAANLSSVFVANTASNPVPVHQQGTASVNVTNTTPVPVQETNTDANGNLKVHEQGTASVAITGTPTVKSGDTAIVLDQGDETLSPGQRLTLNPDSEDVSAYREVTLYLEFIGGDFNTDTEVWADTSDGTPYLFAFDYFQPQDIRVVKTYDPAPARLQLQLWNNSTTSGTEIAYTIVGRTN